MQTQLFEVTEAVPEAVYRINPALMKKALKASEIAIDCETETRWNGVGPEKDFGLSYAAPVTVISFSWQDTNGIWKAAMYASDGNWPEEVREWLREVFEKKLVIFHNAVFDCRQLSKYTGGSVPSKIWDTATNERLLNPVAGKSYSLVNVAQGYGIIVPGRQLDMKKKRGKLHEVELDKLLEYACDDAEQTLKVFYCQRALPIDERGKELLDWENRATYAYCRMAAAGVSINAGRIKERIIDLGRIVDECAQRLAADGLDKPNSPVARQHYIWTVKALPKPDPKLREHSDLFTEKGAFSTGADALELYVRLFPETVDVLDDLITWIDTDRMIATLTGLLEHAATDGKIHSLLGIGTETGRRSSGHPNVQNLKMASKGDDDLAGTLAGALVGDDNATLVEIDYSNAENWIGAMLSGDNNFAAACAAEDFHSAMAERYYGDQWQRADKAERKILRRNGKTITFGTAYGMGGNTLSRQLGCTLEEAYALLDAKDAAFPKVKAAKAAAGKKASATGFINLWTGRRVPCDKRRVYIAWNYCCQGGVGELIKRAIVLISEEYARRGLCSRVAIDMHDAIILSVQHAEWDEALQIASMIMETIMPSDKNERTNPPVRWIAQPDLVENQKKWGFGQHHPEPAPPPPTTIGHVSQGFDIYIGRDHDGFKSTGWGNPYVIGRDGTRAEVVEKYRAFILKKADLLQRLPELRSKRLGCFCKTAAAPDTPCHGDVLAELANLPDGEIERLIELANDRAGDQWGIEFEEIGATITLQDVPGTLEDYFLNADSAEREGLHAVFSRLLDHWNKKAQERLWVHLPPAMGGNRVQVDYPNYRKAIHQWKKIAEAGGEARPFGGDTYPADELAGMFDFATEYIKLVNQKIETLTRYLELLAPQTAQVAA